MSFYLRKSIKIGPLRFNLSKSGIGVSGGVKGFRVGTGPRGNYVHMGTGGVYYRKTFPSRDPQITPPIPLSRGGRRSPSENAVPASRDGVYMSEIESAEVSNMMHASSTDLLQEFAEKKKIMRVGPWVLGLSIVLIVLATIVSVHPVVLGLAGLGLASGVFSAFRRDVLRKTVVLLYDFDPTLEQAYADLHASAKRLAACSGCWHISASGEVKNRKYQAGASNLVDRRPTWIRMVSPDFLQTNIQTIAIKVGRQTLYFFPDRILVLDADNMGAVGYEELQVNLSQTRFIEHALPRDAQVVDHTWRYVNKNGGPDRRFANNTQIPICLYDELRFTSFSGLDEIIQVSQSGVGQAMVQSIHRLAQFTKVHRG